MYAKVSNSGNEVNFLQKAQKLNSGLIKICYKIDHLMYKMGKVIL